MDNDKIVNPTEQPCSYWLSTTTQTNWPQLNEDITVDCAVVGGGMAGLLCAYYISSKGIDTVVIDAGRIAERTSGHTTAKITSQHGLIYDKIKNQMGQELAKQYAEANETAIHEILKIAEENNIKCDYTAEAAYVYTQKDKNINAVENEAKTASDLGIKASFVDEIPLPIPVKAAVMFDGQARFHPRKFLVPLAEKMDKKGVRIFEESRIIDIEENNGRYILTTEQEKKITAKKVVIASHYPFYQKKGMYFSRLYCERAYIIAVKAQEKYPGGMYINAEDPSRSLRGLNSDLDEFVLIAGESHKTGQGKDLHNHYRALAEFAQGIFTIDDIPYRWSAQDCMTLDGIPYIGRYASDTPSLYIATGFQKWGMTGSIVSAMIIKDLISKGESPWQDVYDPSRKNIAGSVKNFIVENLDVAKHFISGKIKPISENYDIKPGEADIVELNGNRAGIYRDENGELHIVNTTCTHMGCELNWNSAEKSWDCPCHGSRFAVSGDIVEGPAVRPLTKESDTSLVEKLIKDQF
ncbi:MAG TPA: FAD-dependent oxidoreductase [Ruminiclostridium sp.]|jgi:glycine/D-amino acid oxidase-like deaminating enzyme/nitrite reductase/ring-hydroxylating ferredoxin subunit|nr:FAD-dependent oxidoreductase [Clostridiaceae bacterium]HAA25986.1 FAD-dependent oxidoreductase [Ruminiclostridium sp.]